MEFHLRVAASKSSDRAAVLAIVRRCGTLLENFRADFKCDREVVLSAVTSDGLALQWAHEDLKRDRELVLAAVASNGRALLWAHEDFKRDRGLVLAAVTSNGRALQWAHEDFTRDRELVLAAVTSNGWALQLAHEDLKRDRELVLAAVTSNGCALEWTHEDLKRDRGLVLAAVTTNGNALQWASRSLRSDREVVLTATQQATMAVRWASSVLLYSSKFITELTQLSYWDQYFAEEVAREFFNRVDRLLRYGSLRDIKEALSIVSILSQSFGLSPEELFGEDDSDDGSDDRCMRMRGYVRRMLDKVREYNMEAELRKLVGLCATEAAAHDDLQRLEALCDEAESDGLFTTWLPSLRRLVHDCKCKDRKTDATSDTARPQFRTSRKAEGAVRFSGGEVPEVHMRLAALLSQQLGDVRFFAQHCRVFSPRQCVYGHRGGFSYVKPAGFVRFALEQGKTVLKEWPVAYHGARVANLNSILRDGLRRPEEPFETRQAGSRTGRSIYLSPCPEYAAFPTYAEFFQLADEHWVQVVLQVRVRPGSFEVRNGTLANKHWPVGLPLDEYHYTNYGLEWLVEDENDVVVVGLLVREFGRKVEPSIYGEIASLVISTGGENAEYVWSKYRATEMQERMLHKSLGLST